MLVILGIAATVSLGFASWLLQSHRLGSQTTKALDDSRHALDFLTRQLEGVVPGSLRISHGGSQLEFLHGTHFGAVNQISAGTIIDAAVQADTGTFFRVSEGEMGTNVFDYAFTGGSTSSSPSLHPNLIFVAFQKCHPNVIDSQCSTPVDSIERESFSLANPSLPLAASDPYALVDYLGCVRLEPTDDGNGLFLRICKAPGFAANCCQQGQRFLVLDPVASIHFANLGAGRLGVRLRHADLPSTPLYRIARAHHE